MIVWEYVMVKALSKLPVPSGDGGGNKDDVGVNKDDGSVDMAPRVDDCGCCT